MVFVQYPLSVFSKMPKLIGPPRRARRPRRGSPLSRTGRVLLALFSWFRIMCYSALFFSPIWAIAVRVVRVRVRGRARRAHAEHVVRIVGVDRRQPPLHG